MPFKRYMEIKRVALVNYGKDYGKLGVFVNVIDQNRATIGIPDVAIPNAEFHPSAPIPSVYPTTNLPTGGIAYAAEGENKEKENEKLLTIEERLRSIEGLNMYGSVDVSSLRLVPDVVVLPKFKVAKFDKYSRNSDPCIHLATYIAKMSALTEDDRLLVHFFHESLLEAALH
ncbi:uncharacterized protein LOC131179445 [Hevea brasiliensis]|uniref:uncharacterized protein LOC131179445 n=1 Tax=Hevea brasiliensis TaxID=3981 RepID=UPI0025FB0CDB|nr:uncharacterized protein LOC131179445 [Hevea brasiliensis]